ncbi:hypothetical protein BK784_24235 [Bacillus thuringiensis serovar medellin]|uniref:Uncharacterized protein n=1 Tax=Bacillus thuringiensis subsp. medellin TaxID=79672 RepID=A0A9X6N0A3_BACTV|nr:hypothetical protein BK784_24235 [Bacillus thuringiensis serovar medellin]
MEKIQSCINADFLLKIGIENIEKKEINRVVIPFNVSCRHFFIACMKWNVNATTQILIMILVDNLVIQRNLVIIQAGQQNI